MLIHPMVHVLWCVVGVVCGVAFGRSLLLPQRAVLTPLPSTSWILHPSGSLRVGSCLVLSQALEAEAGPPQAWPCLS